MPPLKQPQGWRYVKSRLRLLNRPQALGTVAVLLVAGMVLMDYWRRQPIAPPAPSNVPAASAPALVPSDPLATLGQPSIEPSTNPEDAPARPSAIAQPSPAPSAAADLGLLGSPALRSPSALLENPGLTGTSSPPSRPESSGVFGIDSFTPVSPAAPPADPLRSAIARQAQNQTAPSVEPRSPSTSSGSRVSPYATSPPPGTTGYTLPPTLAPSPSGLPAARPEVAGSAAPSVYGVAPAPAAIVPVAPAPAPPSVSNPSIGNGEINTFANP